MPRSRCNMWRRLCFTVRHALELDVWAVSRVHDIRELADFFFHCSFTSILAAMIADPNIHGMPITHPSCFQTPMMPCIRCSLLSTARFPFLRVILPPDQQSAYLPLGLLYCCS